MGKVVYDIFKITIKKYSDNNNTLVVLVDYYKDGKIVEHKRTTNPSFIEKVLSTATSTVKEVEYVNDNLMANYQSDSFIEIVDYDDIKDSKEFSSFNKKVDKIIKKNSPKSKVENKNAKSKSVVKKKPVDDLEKKKILESVKNVKVTKNKKLLRKVALKTKKYLSVATMGLILMSQVMLISRNLENLSFSSQKERLEVEDNMLSDSMTVESEKVFNQASGNQKVSINELLKTSDKQANDNTTSTRTDTVQVESNDSTSSVVPLTEPIIDDSLNVVSEPMQIVNEEVDNVVLEENNKDEALPDTILVKEVTSTDADELVNLEDIVLPQVEIQPELATDLPDDGGNVQVEQSEKVVEEENVESLMESNNNSETQSADSNLDEAEMLLNDNDEETKEESVSISEVGILENIEKSENQDDGNSNSLYTPEELNLQVSETLSKYNLTEEQFDKICAVVQQEAGHNPEEVKNVITTIVNRMESGKWGGTTPWEVVTESGQFEAYGAGNYKKYENHKYEESTAYIVAATLNGDLDTTHDWERFRSNESTEYGGTILTPGGNRYK